MKRWFVTLSCFLIVCLIFGLCARLEVNALSAVFAPKTVQKEIEETVPAPSPKSHEHKYTILANTTSCTESGYIEYLCDCGSSYKERVVATGHEFISRKIYATCIRDGYTEKTCSACGFTTQENIIPALSHTYEERVEPATCKQGEFLTLACTNCGTIAQTTKIKDPLGHQFAKWEDYSDDFHKRICTRSGCDYKEAERHELLNTITIAATCTATGKTQDLCECGKIIKEAELPMVDHVLELYEKVLPRYEEAGYEIFHCANCKYQLKTNYTPKRQHNCVFVETGKAGVSCNAKTYSVVKCIYCQKENMNNSQPTTTHKFRLLSTPATCTTPGYTEKYCSECGLVASKKESQPARGHDYKTTVVEATTGWAGYDLHKCTRCSDSYKDNTKAQLKANEFPKGYKDATCTIIIYKEWYKNAYVYAAHITFTDYTRLFSDCANGKYRNGTETTSHAAQRKGAIFAVNGDYSSPGLDYTVVRAGRIWNGSGRASFWCPAVYSSHNGLLQSAWDGSWSTPGISGGQIDNLVETGKVTDTFSFGPPSMFNGSLANSSDTTRAQRTFIGTNGQAGDIWICVSDGRYNDGKSAGLTFREAAEYLKGKDCTFCVHLDGGGSSTMYFNGQVLNAAKNGQRSVVDFLLFK